ncbi:MAG: ribosome recycling factor [Pseudomonadota bacterium]|jgi:ribosome recycling factor|nr:ribosome recycling factor [Alphaproteobacteria bacterium]
MTVRLESFSQRMQIAIDAFTKELSGLRAGRASINLLDPIKVDAYGSLMPISQVGTVTAPEPRLLVVQVWDKEMVKAVEKAIRESSLGVSPSSDGQLVRVALPDLNEERRQELAKLVSKYAEEAKIHVRNVRREGNDTIKKAEKDKEISEDDERRLTEEMQKITDDHIKKIDTLAATKQKDIMHV